MNPVTHAKLEQRLLLLISKIISEEVTNVNISSPTVMDVKLSHDGSHLNVYVTFLDKQDRSLEALNNTKGFIRSQLAQYWDKRKTPELHFFLDEVSQRTARLEEIFAKIKTEDKK